MAKSDDRDQGSRKVAVIDGQGKDAEVTLYVYLEDDDGDLKELPWPETWPKWVNVQFLEDQGYDVITA